MTANVRFGSKADICGAKRHVRFTPDSDRESGLPKRSCLLYPQKWTCAVQVARYNELRGYKSNEVPMYGHHQHQWQLARPIILSARCPSQAFPFAFLWGHLSGRWEGVEVTQSPAHHKARAQKPQRKARTGAKAVFSRRI